MIQIARAFSLKRSKEANFIDVLKVIAKGGNGGNGGVGFFRSIYSPKGKPCGGNGGKGGNVLFVADDATHSLNAVSKSLKAQNGGAGGKNNLHGKCGDDLRVPVPLGTSILNLETNKLADLDLVNQSFIGAFGGRGGKGNLSLAKNNHEFGEGAPGAQSNFLLEVKTLADVGLVGVPNAGKSSFLRAVSNAHPKVADYPFTTLNPFVGTVDFSDFFQFKIADIPGLIEGAHANKGLGHSFLKHIVKSKIVGYVIDASLEEPWKDVEICMREMELYNKDLLNKKSFIIANKMDLGEAVLENCSKLETLFPRFKVFPVSAKEGTNVEKVTEYLRQLIEKKCE